MLPLASVNTLCIIPHCLLAVRRGHSFGTMPADCASAMVEPGARADGSRHLDTPATIETLHRLHAVSARAAAKAKVSGSFFVPPSECPATCSLPFAKDHIRIAAEIAKLSLLYPNLKGLGDRRFCRQPDAIYAGIHRQCRHDGYRLKP